ncbi:hypothetical protein L6R52_41150, partial [Myxococcota bacterium]|nr:hypothetical protein [Myxococcota bacterium]
RPAAIDYGSDDDEDEEPPHPAEDPRFFAGSSQGFDDEGSAPAADVPPRAPRPQPAAAAQSTAIVEGFRTFVELLKKKRPSLAAMLSQVRPLAFGPGGVELGCDSAFEEGKLKETEPRQYLESLLAEHFGRSVALRVTRVARAEATRTVPVTLSEAEDRDRAERRNEKGVAARSRPAVQALTEELGARVARVRVIDDA